MAYLSLTGQKTGKITGGVVEKGREHTIGVIAVSYGIEAPYDRQSGLPSGKRQHSPLRITKEYDQSTPLLLTLLTTNENIKTWKLDFFAHDRSAVETNNYRIELENARITSYEFRQPDIRDPALIKRACCEDVSFTFQKITWTAIDAARSATDDWASGGA